MYGTIQTKGTKRKMKKNNTDITFAFFGTPELAVTILDELKTVGLVPAVIVTRPDKPKGRGGHSSPPPTKEWAIENDVDALQPEKIKGEFLEEIKNTEWDVFVVAAYGKILPKELLDIPKKGTLNVHPSLLPKLRGPSPIRSAILTDEKETGVSVMLLDEEMDHGPIIAQARVELEEWPPRAALLEGVLAKEGGQLLAEVLPLWINDEIDSKEQDHSKATTCSFLKKEDAEINLADDPYQNLLKIRGYEGWPGAFTFFERNLPGQTGGKRIRVVITDAHIDTSGALVIDKVIPEGKKEMLSADFERSGATSISR
ncbi:MAG: methionyl-tRNA formyltransferase [Candidatus Taylorbacteria bacterium CG10_big_fil_rev_8_21_14_0_10_41_48]|uniref:methionyl-tRNA formyltransferase n=1 Tax=Candidatus Taylorbacteria bacterium CG10_big_fil_rev_8_21_14_0_10_41_48 TaxID=1975024 RepID=A0A2M8LCP8_9BACT|nr:MAG: methionyl-tRNA formyltransferase [Candidatus Taylorbacteria bacterium CG10_big_fil_rev_8_21_14_0_10_41_48]